MYFLHSSLNASEIRVESVDFDTYAHMAAGIIIGIEPDEDWYAKELFDHKVLVGMERDVSRMPIGTLWTIAQAGRMEAQTLKELVDKLTKHFDNQPDTQVTVVINIMRQHDGKYASLMTNINYTRNELINTGFGWYVRQRRLNKLL